MKFPKLDVSLSGVSLLVSFLAFTGVCAGCVPWDFNLLSLAVAVLAVLVTALIGFQILNYFSIVDRLRKTEEEQRRYEKRLKELEDKFSKGFEKEHLFAQASTIALSVTEDKVREFRKKIFLDK